MHYLNDKLCFRMLNSAHHKTRLKKNHPCQGRICWNDPLQTKIEDLKSNTDN